MQQKRATDGTQPGTSILERGSRHKDPNGRAKLKSTCIYVGQERRPRANDEEGYVRLYGPGGIRDVS